MARLRLAEQEEWATALEIIDQAKAFLKEQGIDQWQKGYPDAECIRRDIAGEKGYFVLDEEERAMGYLCLDFAGEPAYEDLRGQWLSGGEPYAVVHRLAFLHSARGKGLAGRVFRLVEQACWENRVYALRCDTDEDNAIMKNLLAKNGFSYCGTIWFDNSVKIAYEKLLKEE